MFEKFLDIFSNLFLNIFEILKFFEHFCRCVDAHSGAVLRSGEDVNLCRSVGEHTLPREGVNVRKGVGLHF